ncbi:MAG: hypothetical protein JJT88_20815, partial [Gammaproteobacteria bacterium]|nr:hypothetical protein [Gammaproteobacteria bacterium]
TLAGRVWAGNGRPEKASTRLPVWRLEARPSPPAAGAPAAGAPVAGTPAASADSPPADAYDQDATDFDDDIPF